MSTRPLDVHALIEVLMVGDVPVFAPVEIAEVEDDGPVRRRRASWGHI